MFTLDYIEKFLNLKGVIVKNIVNYDPHMIMSSYTTNDYVPTIV